MDMSFLHRDLKENELEQIKEIVDQRFAELKKNWLEEYEKDKKMWRKQFEDEQKMLDKQIQQKEKELNECKNELIHQKEIIRKLEIKFFEMATSKDEAEKLTNALYKQVMDLQKEMDCKFDDFYREISNKFTKAEQTLNEFIIYTSDITVKTNKLEKQISATDQHIRTTVQSNVRFLSEEIKNIREKVISSNLRTQIKQQLAKINHKKLIQMNKDSAALKQLQMGHKFNSRILQTTQQKIEFEKVNTINCKIQLDALYNRKKTSKFHLVCQNNLPITDQLFDQGININCINEDGCAPLHLAVLNKNLNLVKEFIKHGANTNCQNKYGITPLMLAVVYDPKILRYLLENGADPNIKLEHGLSVLHIAVLNGNHVIVRILLKYEANVNAFINRKIAPIHIALSLNYETICKELKKHSTLQDYQFDCITFVKALLEIITPVNQQIHLQSFTFDLLIALCQFSYYCETLGKLGLISILLKHLDYYLEYCNFEENIVIIWQILFKLSESSPNNCKILMDHDCVNYFLKIVKKFPSEVKCFNFMLKTMANITEIDCYRISLIDSFFINILLKAFEKNNANCELCILILCYLMMVEPEYWPIVDPTRKDILQKIKMATKQLYSYDIIYNKSKYFASLFKFLQCTNVPQIQFYGVSALLKTIQSSPNIYCPLIKELKGINILTSVLDDFHVSQEIKSLIHELITVYNSDVN